MCESEGNGCSFIAPGNCATVPVDQVGWWRESFRCTNCGRKHALNMPCRPRRAARSARSSSMTSNSTATEPANRGRVRGAKPRQAKEVVARESSTDPSDSDASSATVDPSDVKRKEKKDNGTTAALPIFTKLGPAHRGRLELVKWRGRKTGCGTTSYGFAGCEVGSKEEKRKRDRFAQCGLCEETFALSGDTGLAGFRWTCCGVMYSEGYSGCAHHGLLREWDVCTCERCEAGEKATSKDRLLERTLQRSMGLQLSMGPDAQDEENEEQTQKAAGAMLGLAAGMFGEGGFDAFMATTMAMLSGGGIDDEEDEDEGDGS
ncbi:unnamed protein product [Amoebophrya sp. A25]|nr:unnamed protein product [Amoebophrya sp. A25]|eukprot:GSA25T00016249001.1